MPRSYKGLCAALSSIQESKLAPFILEKAEEGGELLDAALLLFGDLIASVDLPPILKSLDALIEEPILSNAFKKYLQERFCYECWEFWVDVKTFRCSFECFTAELEATAYVFPFFFFLMLNEQQRSIPNL